MWQTIPTPNKNNKKNGGNTQPINLDTTTQLNMQKGYNIDKVHKVSKLKDGRSIHPTNTIMAAKHPPKTITNTTMAAKHPPSKTGGKTSARRQPIQRRQCGQNEAKAGAEPRTPRGEKATTTSTNGRARVREQFQ